MSGSTNLAPAAGIEHEAGLAYAEITRLIERLHRRYLDVIRYELSRIGVDAINPVQALLLLNVQGAGVTMRELVERGYHIGSNVTYNVRQLVEAGYIEQQRSERDKRAMKLRLTEAGHELCNRLSEMETVHSATLVEQTDEADTIRGRDLLRALERVWSDYIRYSSA
jgi:DNA-binding MarR family transcriptional regulator